MTDLKIKTNPDLELVFKNYPDSIRPKMQKLRELILSTAREIEGISEIEETLKWGEPSYLVKKGSTIRMDWKSKNPNQYALYFKCTSKLVLTFREVFGDTFNYEKNRALIFTLNDKLPTKELKQCITAGLTYHQVKMLDNLGIK